jgi:hypothetical protein
MQRRLTRGRGDKTWKASSHNEKRRPDVQTAVMRLRWSHATPIRLQSVVMQHQSLWVWALFLPSSAKQSSRRRLCTPR